MSNAAEGDIMPPINEMTAATDTSLHAGTASGGKQRRSRAPIRAAQAAPRKRDDDDDEHSADGRRRHSRPSAAPGHHRSKITSMEEFITTAKQQLQRQCTANGPMPRAAAASSTAKGPTIQQLWLRIAGSMRDEIYTAIDVHRNNHLRESPRRHKRRRLSISEHSPAISHPEESSKQSYCTICMPKQSPTRARTICGHYLCWACLCKWHNNRDVASSRSTSKKYKKCPCCEKYLSKNEVTMIAEGGDRRGETGGAPMSAEIALSLGKEQRDKLLEAATMRILNPALMQGSIEGRSTSVSNSLYDLGSSYIDQLSSNKHQTIRESEMAISMPMTAPLTDQGVLALGDSLSIDNLHGLEQASSTSEEIIFADADLQHLHIETTANEHCSITLWPQLDFASNDDALAHFYISSATEEQNIKILNERNIIDPERSSSVPENVITTDSTVLMHRGQQAEKVLELQDALTDRGINRNKETSQYQLIKQDKEEAITLKQQISISPHEELALDLVDTTSLCESSERFAVDCLVNDMGFDVIGMSYEELNLWINEQELPPAENEALKP